MNPKSFLEYLKTGAPVPTQDYEAWDLGYVPGRGYPDYDGYTEIEPWNRISKTPLQKHDEVYHPDGYKPGDVCKFRERLDAGDNGDMLDPDYVLGEQRPMKNVWAAYDQCMEVLTSVDATLWRLRDSQGGSLGDGTLRRLKEVVRRAPVYKDILHSAVAMNKYNKKPAEKIEGVIDDIVRFVGEGYNTPIGRLPRKDAFFNAAERRSKELRPHSDDDNFGSPLNDVIFKYLNLDSNGSPHL